MEWTQDKTRNADGSPFHAGSESTDNSFLRAGVIPGYRRIYDNGVELWPGNHGVIPEDWDGSYPVEPTIRYNPRSGRSRRG